MAAPSRRNHLSATSVLYVTAQCQWRRSYAVSARWHTVTFAASQRSGRACPPLLAKLSLFYGLPETQLRKLQMVQNSAAMLNTGTRRRDHITPVLFSLHWLPFRQRIEFKLLLLVFRAAHHLCPVYLSSLVIPYTSTRTLRSADQHLLTIPRYHLERYGRRAFFCVRADTVERPASSN